MYKDELVLLASKHEKERVIRPIFYEKIGCNIVTSDFDTDVFGTFTGDVARKHNAYDTCVLKAKTAAIERGFCFGMASEGSFGPHPSMPFLPGAQEIMVFVDLKNNWVIKENIFTTDTNYRHMVVNAETDLEPFLAQVLFPEHALTLQLNASKKVIAKGIQSIDALKDLMQLGFQQESELLLGSDMRAMMNPTRMGILSTLSLNLAEKILRSCVECYAPGFGLLSKEGALPCNSCGAPSSLYQHEVWGCIRCEHQERRPRQDGQFSADPRFCNECNP